jgi:predicted N-acyltransferase
MRAGVINRLDELADGQWNRVAGTRNPFLRSEFLAALEHHGCVGEAFGWYPQHLVVYDDSGEPDGVAPLYLKDNSYGEFVFDWSWADAYQRSGRRYYPKLVSAIPYTPVTGPRLLVRTGADRSVVIDALVQKALELTRETDSSSLHWLFTDDADTDALQNYGLLRRTGCHFHWHNRAYPSFDDFLQQLNSRKRKKIRRERRYITDAGIRMEIIHGNDASEALWATMHRFYRSTFERKSGIATLSLDFFLDICQTMGEQVVLVFALDGKREVAGAINLRSDTALYGRHWGCSEHYHSLHFETCYYQGIDYCIANRLSLFEPGAQGEHKISRGFLPTLTWSAHWLEDAPFREAVSRFLANEHEMMLDYYKDMSACSPYRQDRDTQGEDG